MKKIIGFENSVGDSGGTVGGELGVEGSNVKAELHALFPIAKILAPVEGVVRSGLAKIDAIIPGDQKALFDQMSKDLMEQLAKVLSE